MSTSKKTVVRAIRLQKSVDDLLQKDAKNNRTSVNALISGMTTKYAEWDRYTERFGFVSLTGELFRSILDVGDESRIIEVGKKLGSRLPKEVILFFFKKVNLETFLAYISIFCRYGRVADYELEVEGREYTITAHHDLGGKWSKFLQAFIGEALKSMLGLRARIDVSEGSVVVSFNV